MKLTSKKALEIIEEYRNKMKDTGWIDHSICVGNSAGKIAESLDLDVDKAKALGYIHDIGKGVGEFRDKVFEIQGDYAYLQCENACHNKLYYNYELVKK